ncbi:MAG TPA: glycosyltransferase [Candidatus Brocadiia bacterium]|nr:glycosyltransferase [Planctomycetota bacterium]MDO8092493.1 glycosyltransferase [Candidatus Brocadiales bacterium]
MNILFICAFIPYPPHGGAYQRTYNLLKHIAKNNDVYLIGFIKEKNDPENANYLKKICKEVHAFYLPDDWSRISLVKSLFLNLFSQLPYTAQKYYSMQARQTIAKLIRRVNFDILQCDMIDLAGYIYDYNPKATVLVNHNVESTLILRHAEVEKNPLKKWFFYLQYKKLLRYERKMCPMFKCCVAVSELDKQQLQLISPQARFSVVPNGVDVDYFQPQKTQVEKNTLIFAGRTDWLPNIDGLKFFYQEILPLIKKEIKDVRLTIIGKARTNNDIGLPLTENVTHLGFVEDVRPYIGKAAVYIVPLRIGGGTRLKILDAMAMGKAIVSTSIGAEGIDVTHGKNILIADTPEDFSKQVIRVLNDSNLRESLGKEGRKLVEEKYSWDIIGKKMDEIYNTTHI